MNILYLSHVSWNWTKQRPQFLAEELSHFYNVKYVQKSSFRKQAANNSETIPIKRLVRFPLSRFGFVKWINNHFFKLQLFFSCLKSDIIWFTSPEMFDCIPRFFFKKKLTVYDCMDDMIELFPLDKKMGIKEKQLYNEASIVFASSSYLADKLKSRYGDKKIEIINNAISSHFENTSISLPLEYLVHFIEGKKIMTYVGSISSWMDFELLTSIHNAFPQIIINLWGPHHFKVPQIEGINYCGPVDHKYVSTILSSSDILIMPFVVNELIRSVNPVKLYEYIYSGKPCLAPKYGESLQFKDFVCLYDNREDCISFIDKILEGELKQKTAAECNLFVESNTWRSRVGSINKIISTSIIQ